MKHRIIFLCLVSAALTVCSKNPNTQHGPITLIAGDLSATFIDNSAFGESHRAGYNGIAELRHSAQESTLFVPLYAGLNIEHIFGGDSLQEKFEPRRHPMQLEKSGDNQVVLHELQTPISHMESWTTFTLTPPHYIDIDFRCTFHSIEFFKHDYAGIFWASYINSPPDRKIYFYGRKKDSALQWLSAWSPKHGFKSTHLGIADTLDLFMGDNFEVTLASHFSDLRFEQPFYYGRFHNMVFAYLFDPSKDGLVRFSQSPTGGGAKNPAWDFQFLIPEVQAGKSYGFSVRLVYKEFSSSEDIADEFKAWRRQRANHNGQKAK